MEPRLRNTMGSFAWWWWQPMIAPKIIWTGDKTSFSFSLFYNKIDFLEQKNRNFFYY